MAFNLGTDQPYFVLAFTDSSNSLGQNASTDQILLIEFQTSTLSGVSNNTLAADPSSTQFNLFDNTTGAYLEGPNGQQNVQTIDYDLGNFSALADEQVQGIWIGMGLSAGAGPEEELTVNSLTVSGTQVPEPASITLLGAALVGLGLIRRKRAG